MYQNRFRHPQRAVVQRLNEGIANRETRAKLDAIDAEMTRFKGPQPINEAVVAYGSGMQSHFNELRGDGTFTDAQMEGRLQYAMDEVRRNFGPRQEAYRKYEPTVVAIHDGKRRHFSLRLDGWEIGTIN